MSMGSNRGKILVLDNYDSFTYNLVHVLEKVTGNHVDVFRNDEIELDTVEVYDKIILSPGPGLPAEANLLMPLIKKYAATKSILGVCLGHQAIGEVFGAKMVNLDTVYHGISGSVHVLGEYAGRGLYRDMPASFETGRYHSWILSEKEFPEELEVTARDDNGLIMAIQHRSYKVHGVQFHPESVMTPLGEQLLKNWVAL